jgi:hypothetical protein
MNTIMNTPNTKPLTRKQKKWRRFREYLKQKKLEKQLEDYFDDFDEDLFYDDNGLSRLVAQIYAERNSETHKQKIYDELDKFITDNEQTENIRDFAISGRDLYDGKKMYNTMKNDPNPKYEIFGSNGGGYTCFGLYKSKDQNMYIIIVRVQTPVHYIKIEDNTIFGNYTDRKEK